jgi:hypothetical protein
MPDLAAAGEGSAGELLPATFLSFPSLADEEEAPVGASDSAAFSMEAISRCFLTTAEAFFTNLVLALAWGVALGFVTEAVPALADSRIFRVGVFFLEEMKSACLAEPPLGELGGV